MQIRKKYIWLSAKNQDNLSSLVLIAKNENEIHLIVSQKWRQLVFLGSNCKNWEWNSFVEFSLVLIAMPKLLRSPSLIMPWKSKKSYLKIYFLCKNCMVGRWDSVHRSRIKRASIIGGKSHWFFGQWVQPNLTSFPIFSFQVQLWCV